MTHLLHSGEWMYLYSGRCIYRRDQPESEDGFSVTQAIRLKDVSSVKMDDNEHTVTIYVKGHTTPIFVEFGRRGIHSFNAFTLFTKQLTNALVTVGLCNELFYDGFSMKRGQLLAKAKPRADDLNSDDEECVECNKETSPFSKPLETT